MEYLLILAALGLAFSNGANDNFKGFATVWGSATLSYRQALILASVATVAGSLLSLYLAQGLAQQFSGKGLVPDAAVNAPQFLMSVGAGAAATVFIATRVGLPISTTHALIGGLIGAGLAQSGGEVHFAKLADSFLLPLLVSPFLAASLGWVAYRLLRLRSADKDCACLTVPSNAMLSAVKGRATLMTVSAPSIVIAPAAQCDALDTPIARLSIPRFMDRVHTLSAGLICFARGVNDTPKLAALLIAAHMFDIRFSVALIAVVMMAGGLLFSRHVAETMSRRMTRMDHTQGLAANLITATLVLFASKLGLPVSTTHVSVGSIAGVGAGAGTLDWSMLRNILLSWVATLPLAACLAWVAVKLAAG